MSDTVLQLNNVESAYGPIRAIRGVSLSVKRGQIAAVLGSNGAGKTTVLKTISGILDPRKGTVFFNGENITAMDPAHIVQRGLVQVPEGREVFPLLSVRDNLALGRMTRLNRERGTTMLLVEQNANMALNVADYGFVLESGRIVMEDTCERLLEKDDIKEFYLGLKEAGARDERRWKKKKTWR